MNSFKPLKKNRNTQKHMERFLSYTANEFLSGSTQVGNGNPSDIAELIRWTEIGPVAGQFAMILGYIEIGKREGAKLVCGGEPLDTHKGYYLRPALFTDTSNDMRINREEIFGPVASIIHVADYEEALTIANDTEFGLSAGIWTTSLKYAEDFQAKAQAGMTMVNLPTVGVGYHVPFGGSKGSSYGLCEQGPEIATSYVAP